MYMSMPHEKTLSLSLSRPDICNGAFWRTCLVIKPMLKEKPILFGFLF